jgi:hypothetical protein
MMACIKYSKSLYEEVKVGSKHKGSQYGESDRMIQEVTINRNLVPGRREVEEKKKSW